MDLYSTYYDEIHRFTFTGTAVGWFPDRVEDDWGDRGRDQHLVRGERDLV